MNKMLLSLAATTLLAATPVAAKDKPKPKAKTSVTHKVSTKKAVKRKTHAKPLALKKVAKKEKILVKGKTIPATRGFTPYLGVEAQWRHMGFKPDLGNNLFKHDYAQANLYGGFKLTPMIGIEAGFESNVRKNRTTFMNPGEVSAGVVLVAPTQYTASAELKGPHINLVFSTPRNEYCMNFIGLIGMAQLKGKFKRDTNYIYVNQIPYDPSTLGIDRTSTYEQKKNILRLGAGIEHMFVSNWGLRTSFIWENTNKINITAKETPVGEISIIRMKNSLIYSIGTFVTF